MREKGINSMSEEELREELKRIREERSGKGRVKRAQARTKRMDGQVKEKRRKQDVEAVEKAEWV